MTQLRSVCCEFVQGVLAAALVLSCATRGAQGQLPSRELVREIASAASHTSARETDSLRAIAARTPGMLRGLVALAADRTEAMLDRMNALVLVGQLRSPEGLTVLTSFADTVSESDLLRRASLAGLALYGAVPQVLASLERFLASDRESDREAAAAALLSMAVRDRAEAIFPLVQRAMDRERAVGVRQLLERTLRQLSGGP